MNRFASVVKLVEVEWSSRCVAALLFSFALPLLTLTGLAWAAVAGRISGVVTDPSGAVISQATVVLTSTATGIKQSTATNGQGFYSFAVVPVGEYDLQIDSTNFQTYHRTGLVVDVSSAALVNASLRLRESRQAIEVNDATVQIEIADTELGQTVASKHVTEVPLNGRAYTDLLAVQGVSPITTSGATNSSSGGGYGTVPVAGNNNTGEFSINGQRESANGFFLNGASVQETIGQQAGIIPNLDSIAEFRIITNNSDAEFGGYSGGLVNVATKSGGNDFHGSIFEFLRNTQLDARGFFSPERSVFQQNQYGGALGGPIRKNRIFFFSDYQGQRTRQGIETGIVPVPSLANRAGEFSDLTGTVNGDYLAQVLTQRLGYQIANGDPFSNVFPNGVIPQRAFAAPALKMLRFIPLPNVGANRFSSGAAKRRINDDKGSARVDANTAKYGTFSAYYFLDKYTLDDPYPSAFGGATVPGPNGAYNALSTGTDQLIVLQNTKTIGDSMVNQAHLSFSRLSNTLGVPKAA